MKFFQWLTGLRELRVARSLDHDERRRLPRLRCYFKIQVQDAGRQNHEAFLVEMNSQGVRFHCAQEFQSGQTLHLHYCFAPTVPAKAGPKGGSSLPVRVIWNRNRRHTNALMGCEFLLPPEQLRESWAGQILQQLGFPVGQDPRTLSARQSIRYPAHIIKARVQAPTLTTDVKVLDLGAGGALVETDVALPEDVVLEIIDPPGLTNRLRMVCRCLNCRPGPDKKVLCHLQWVYLTPHETRQLGVLLFHLLRGESGSDEPCSSAL